MHSKYDLKHGRWCAEHETEGNSGQYMSVCEAKPGRLFAKWLFHMTSVEILDSVLCLFSNL